MIWLSYYFINNFIDAAEIFEPSTEQTKYVQEGENITLRCTGVGHPPPEVKWGKLNGSFNDRAFSTNMSISTNEGNITRVTVDLTLTRVSRENTGVYECLVSNLLSYDTKITSLIVQCMYFN